jgi:hypothetical protein
LLQKRSERRSFYCDGCPRKPGRHPNKCLAIHTLRKYTLVCYYYYYCYCYYYRLLTQVFPVFLSLNQWCTSPLRLQESDCSTFLSMCDVPRMAIVCNEFMECLPGISSRYFLSPLVAVPVIINIIIALQPIVRPWPFFQFLYVIHSRQDSSDGRSASRKAATYTQNNRNRINAYRHPCLD